MSHTLVNYYFGGRQGLLTAAYALTIAPHEVVAASRDRSGRLDPAVLIARLVAVWEQPVHREALTGFARQAVGGEGRDVVVDYLQRAVFAEFVAELGIARGRRLGITIVGTIVARYLLELPGLAAAPADDVVRLMRATAGC